MNLDDEPGLREKIKKKTTTTKQKWEPFAIKFT